MRKKPKVAERAGLPQGLLGGGRVQQEIGAVPPLATRPSQIRPAGGSEAVWCIARVDRFPATGKITHNAQRLSVAGRTSRGRRRASRDAGSLPRPRAVPRVRTFGLATKVTRLVRLRATIAIRCSITSNIGRRDFTKAIRRTRTLRMLAYNYCKRSPSAS